MKKYRISRDKEMELITITKEGEDMEILIIDCEDAEAEFLEKLILYANFGLEEEDDILYGDESLYDL